MRQNRWSLVALTLIALVFCGSQVSQAFDFGGLLEDLSKPKSAPKSEEPKKEAAPPAEENKAKDGGLIGLGESLGILDKKSGDILKGSVQTLKAFQPIGYEEERAIGGSLAVQVFDRFGGPYKNDALTRYVNLVGRAVADVSDRPDVEYHFAILNTEHPNAFATPGGYVFVSIGLLKLLRNEAELAGVLGHEIAHITHKHALQTIQRGQALKGLTSLTLTAMNKNMGLFDKVIDEVSGILFTHGLDKNLEYEADKVGTEYAFRMGYNAEGLRNFIAVLGERHSGETSIFSSTHPSPGDRIAHLDMARYKPYGLYPVLSKRYESEVKGKL